MRDAAGPVATSRQSPHPSTLATSPSVDHSYSSYGWVPSFVPSGSYSGTGAVPPSGTMGFSPTNSHSSIQSQSQEYLGYIQHTPSHSSRQTDWQAAASQGQGPMPRLSWLLRCSPSPEAMPPDNSGWNRPYNASQESSPCQAKNQLSVLGDGYQPNAAGYIPDSGSQGPWNHYGNLRNDANPTPGHVLIDPSLPGLWSTSHHHPCNEPLGTMDMVTQNTMTTPRPGMFTVFEQLPVTTYAENATWQSGTAETSRLDCSALVGISYGMDSSVGYNTHYTYHADPSEQGTSHCSEDLCYPANTAAPTAYQPTASGSPSEDATATVTNSYDSQLVPEYYLNSDPSAFSGSPPAPQPAARQPSESLDTATRARSQGRGISKKNSGGRPKGSHLLPSQREGAREMRSVTACWSCAIRRDKVRPSCSD